jgi:hypothetical protein
MDRETAWRQLQAASRTEAAATPETRTSAAAALSEAAKEWARASGWREPRAEAPAGGEVLTFGFGSGRGQPPSAVDTKSLRWYAKVLAENVANVEKARWVTQNQALLDAVEAELEGR